MIFHDACRLKTFISRELRELVAASSDRPGVWQRLEEKSDPSLESQFDAWVNSAQPVVKYVSQPTVSLYQTSDSLQMTVVAISVLYTLTCEEAICDAPDDQ